MERIYGTYRIASGREERRIDRRLVRQPVQRLNIALCLVSILVVGGQFSNSKSPNSYRDQSIGLTLWVKCSHYNVFNQL
jgi:hypothetical protein